MGYYLRDGGRGVVYREPVDGFRGEGGDARDFGAEGGGEEDLEINILVWAELKMKKGKENLQATSHSRSNDR
jgi:hypothetical protein